jgi:hypothetical protein
MNRLAADRRAWVEIYGNTKSKKVNKLERAMGIEPE